ncbi:MAG: hypothetical protein SPF98_05120 [Campylobacter sp.]|nr:hypothetical protein [Campylobacter sp.]
MKINMEQIFKGLKAWRNERKITAKSQRKGYLVNVMEEFGELAAALRDYDKFGEDDCHYSKEYKQKAEHEIIDSICDIAVFTINAMSDMPCHLKETKIEWEDDFCDDFCDLIRQISWLSADFNNKGCMWSPQRFNLILAQLAQICEKYGFNFEIAMLETIKEISSRTGSYNEATKKWEKYTSDEAQAKWYKADYEKARLYNLGK